MDSIFGLDNPADIGKGFTAVITAFSNEELFVIKGILDDAEIPYLAKARGSGSAVGVIMGFNMYGTDIFVRDEDLELAKQLLFFEETEDGQTDNEEEL